MRLDKFLKVSRILKRRSVANTACDAQKVLIGSKAAKAGAQIKIGDIITVALGNNRTSFRVLSTNENAKKQEADSMYEIIATEEQS